MALHLKRIAADHKANAKRLAYSKFANMSDEDITALLKTKTGMQEAMLFVLSAIRGMAKP